MESNESVHCIGLAGYPGAGKSTVAELLADKLDSPSLAMGDIVRDRVDETPDEELLAIGLDSDSEKTRARAQSGEVTGEMIGEWVTATLDDQADAVARWGIEYINDLPHDDYIVLDGIRTLADIDTFSDAFDQFTLVFVEADFETRLNRLQDRGRDGEDSFDAADLKTRDAREDDWGVGDILDDDLPDYFLSNDGDLDDLHAELDTFLDAIDAHGTESVSPR